MTCAEGAPPPLRACGKAGRGPNLNKSGPRRVTARSSLGYAYHTVLLPPLCSNVQSIHMGL